MSAQGIVEQVLGASLMAVVLLDVFFTVLYARAGTGIISTRLARITWYVFRAIAKASRNRRGMILSFCGPAILVLLVLVWAFGLAVGTALIFHPHLGVSVKASTGTTERDFLTALFAGASSISIVGSGKYEPTTAPFKIFYLFNSLVGMSVISLTLTYLMQIYSALQTRNSVALNLQLSTEESGDAAKFIAGVGPQGKFETAYTTLTDLATKIANIKETHHFYPVLFYFRFDEPYYAMSRLTNVSLDAVSIVCSALDEKRYRWFINSGAVKDIWNSSLLLVTTLEKTFVPGEVPKPGIHDRNTVARWRSRFFEATKQLEEAGIELRANLDVAAESYVEQRAQWNSHVHNLGDSLLYDKRDIDPALYCAKEEERDRAA